MSKSKYDRRNWFAFILFESRNQVIKIFLLGGWLVGWSVGWSVSWLVGWSVGWLVVFFPLKETRLCAENSVLSLDIAGQTAHLCFSM